MKFILGIVSGIAGIVLLASIVVEAQYLSFATDDFAVRLVMSLLGLGLIHLGYRLVTSGATGNGAKK